MSKKLLTDVAIYDNLALSANTQPMTPSFGENHSEELKSNAMLAFVPPGYRGHVRLPEIPTRRARAREQWQKRRGDGYEVWGGE